MNWILTILSLGSAGIGALSMLALLAVFGWRPRQRQTNMIKNNSFTSNKKGWHL